MYFTRCIPLFFILSDPSLRVCNAKVLSISIFNALKTNRNNMILKKAHYKC